MRIPGVDKATENLAKWAGRDEWDEPHAEIYASHIDPVADLLDMSGDEIAALLGDSAVMLTSSLPRTSLPPASAKTTS